MTTVSVLGCGWLGLPLAAQLVKDGYNVKGSSMHEDGLENIRQGGVEAHQIGFDPELNSNADHGFFESDVLISCIPPRRRDDIESFYPLQFQHLVEQIKKGGIKKVLLISSTSVYPNTGGIVREDDQLLPDKPSGRALVKVEQLLHDEKAFETTVLRFGGLIGYDRHPGRFLSGRRQLKDGDVPVNLIHRDDCIGIIQKIFNTNYWGKTVHASSPEHPTRREFYTLAAKHANLPVPEFTGNTAADRFKIIDPTKLIKELDYQFIYNNPLETITQ